MGLCAAKAALKKVYSSVVLSISNATKRSNSALLISVSSASGPPSSRSRARFVFCAINASIFSSTVPRQTNLCTSTLRFLADPEGAVRGLVFHGGIPPAVKMNHLRRRREIQPRAAGLERQHKERRAVIPLKSLDQFAPFANGSLAVQDQPRPPENAGKKIRQRRRNLAELREDQRLLLPLRQLLADLTRRRANFPLSSASYRLSRVHCEGWLQICFSRISYASTMPRRLIPSA